MARFRFHGVDPGPALNLSVSKDAQIEGVRCGGWKKKKGIHSDGTVSGPSVSVTRSASREQCCELTRKDFAAAESELLGAGTEGFHPNPALCYVSVLSPSADPSLEPS